MPNVTRPNNGGDKARVVITVPRRPSQFESALAEIPDSGVLIETHAAFLHLSRLARARLVLVSPFLDEAGARWAISMFEATPAPERVLLCRNVSAFDDLPMDCKQALETLGVQIRTYALIHEKDGRYVGRESFHAKIVLADQVAARPRSSKGSSSSQSFCSAYVRRPQAHGSPTVKAADFPICCRCPRSSRRAGASRHHRSPELHRRNTLKRNGDVDQQPYSRLEPVGLLGAARSHSSLESARVARARMGSECG